MRWLRILFSLLAQLFFLAFMLPLVMVRAYFDTDAEHLDERS